MPYSPVVISLPIADRQTSYRFYHDGLGLETIGEPASDGLPEPLQFVVNDGLRLMLVPAGGFGWVIGANQVAPRGQTECVLGLTAPSPDEVEQMVARASAAGAGIVVEPAAQPWGFTAVLADPDGHLVMLSAQPAG